MTRIRIQGGRRLDGIVKISGAKNAALPIMAASLLSDGEVILEDIPRLEDVRTIQEVLRSLGVKIAAGQSSKSSVLRLDASDVRAVEAPYDLVRKMRASFLIMGPMLARFRYAKIFLPGGCAIGTRPIDLHLKGFESLGASIAREHGYVEATAGNGLSGGHVYLDFPSVGATENIMMAATLATGTTIIENAAKEPEVVDLASFLNAMGANIRGAGTNIIRIEGVKRLGGATHAILPDRIEAGTYMIAASITHGDVFVKNALPEHLKPLIAKLREIGVRVDEEATGIRVRSSVMLKSADVKTMPYPGFPTDLQAQVAALLSIAQGTSIITETVFENRFMYVDELKRMGANIKIDGRTAIIEGMPRLTGAPVKATDLRAGAALILAALVAEGETEVSEVHHIDRGYENIEIKLSKLGATIERVEREQAGPGLAGCLEGSKPLDIAI
ncbi:MAG: UDP-N-acetylglucosamine 1-carboxyvinyltransferase [Firmicutes bacterium]|nr:UDP-N-acetylglucosamine 1-carboxyvinyltransferase [Bacillota bacterium]